MKFKVGHIYDEIYKKNIYFIPNGNNRALKEFIRIQFNGIYDEDRDFAGRTSNYFYNGLDYYIITLKKLNNKPKSLSYLAHECLHVSLYILDNCGVDYDGDNCEQLNYHFEWLFKKCLEHKKWKEYDY